MGDEDISFELGDTVLLVGGQIDGTRGRIYYMDETLIRILPEGVSDRLVDIPIIDGDLDPSLKIDHLYSISKRTNQAFVAQINAQVGEMAETFGDNGVPGAKYMITAVDESNDTIALVDETQGTKSIDFAFRGIPRDEGFAILRPRQVPVIEEEMEAVAEEAATEETDAFEDVLNAELAASDEAEIREISVSQRTYPDNLQRNDMLQDMISALDITSQKNPERQKEIRTLVEQFMLLRNSILTYSPSGEPSGPIASSYTTIADLIEAKTIPLSRPVMNAKRILYVDHTAEALIQMSLGNPSSDPTEIPDTEIDVRYLEDVVKQTIDYMETQLGGIQSENLSADSLPEWYLSWQTLNRIYHSTWSISGKEISTPFKQDTEFLRFPIGDVDVPATDGLPALGDDKDVVITSDSVEKIQLSLLRGLGPRSTRLRANAPPRIIEPAEARSVQNTLIFPLSEQRNLGSTRSGRIADDIANSHFTPQTLLQILERLGGISALPTTGGIISVGEGGNTNGSIPVEDWLANQPLYPLGLADAIISLASYGFTNQEFSIQQQDAIVTKIDSYRALIKQYITEMRDSMVVVLSQQKSEENTFLKGDAYDTLFKILEGEPLLSAIMKELQGAMPLYKRNDTAMVAGIMKTSVDFFLTTMAQIPGPLGRERNRKVRDQYLQALTNALIKSENKMSEVLTPEPNTCPHVKDYSILRKQKDKSLQMQLFAKFLTRYEGKRENNWVDCSVCKQHLVCYHEVLLLKEFLHPREKDTLHKELLLSFSGGQFHGKYICKNCGQPISELDFDTSMEFTDDGKPTSGRAVLDQEDAAIGDVLDEILGPAAAQEKEQEFATEDQKTIYMGVRKLFDTIGIHAKEDAYRRILQRVESELVKQVSREQYKQMTKGKRAIDYDIFINRILVGSLGVNCLLEIQTDVPGYVMRYKLPGCRAGFSGFPVGNEKDRTGIEYIVCAIGAIRENNPPWNKTGFQNESNEKKRQDAIQVIINRLLDSLLTNANVQVQISIKRAFLQKVYGTVMHSEQLPERIPDGFRPFPYVVSGEEAAAAPVVSEAATPREKIRGWVSSAHQLGKDNGNYVKGNPLVDATCCMASIQEPGKFWKEVANKLPTLPLKTPPTGPINSHLTVHFKPRPQGVLEGSVSSDIMYRIFLKVCYDGPRKGQPHEPGYTNICTHCAFIFPYNPYTPQPFPPVSADSIKTYIEEIEAIVTKGKVALETQHVPVNEAAFKSILDATHKASRVEPYRLTVPKTGMELLQMLQSIKPEPFDGWSTMISATIVKIAKLTPNPSDFDIAEAYGELSNFAAEAIETFKRRIGNENGVALQKILEDPSAVESILTYVLIPIQRLVTGFSIASLRVSRGYELGRGTEDDVNTNLRNHVNFLSDLSKRATGATLEKMKWARSRLSDAIVILQKYIRAGYIIGGATGVSYIITALLGGILADFIDPDSAPPQGYSAGILDVGSQGAKQILDICIQKLRKEGLKYTDQQIAEIISRRDEIEKNSFISRFENLTPQEKGMAKMNKKLGLKEWAVGGTKAIYAYNPEQYEIERTQRDEMGFTELVETGGEGGEEGYSNEQVQEDDY